MEAVLPGWYIVLLYARWNVTCPLTLPPVTASKLPTQFIITANYRRQLISPLLSGPFNYSQEVSPMKAVQTALTRLGHGERAGGINGAGDLPY